MVPPFSKGGLGGIKMIPLSERTFGIPYISIFPCKKATCRGGPACPPWTHTWMRPDKKQHYRAVIYGPWAPPQSMKRLVGRASPPAAFGSTGFQPVHCTGKMPVPPRIFQSSRSWPMAHPQIMKCGWLSIMVRGAHIHINLEL